MQAIFERAGRPRGHRAPRSLARRAAAARSSTTRSRPPRALRELGAGLVDLHGQHEHQALLDPLEHLDLLDAFAEHAEVVANVAARFDAWRAAIAALDRTRLDEREKRARIELATFQLQEIDARRPGRRRGRGASRPSEPCSPTRTGSADGPTEAYAALYEGDSAALERARRRLEARSHDLAALDARFRAVPRTARRDRSRGSKISRSCCASYAADLEASPDRLQAVEDRLAAIERLKKKYGPTLADVLARATALRDGAGGARRPSDERAAALDARERDARDALPRRRRGALARAPRGGPQARGRRSKQALAELAMPQSQGGRAGSTTCREPDRWTARGIDSVEFFLSPNPGRGRAAARANRVGRRAVAHHAGAASLAVRGRAGPHARLRRSRRRHRRRAPPTPSARASRPSARRYQILCVTHLPQIAARGGRALSIDKTRPRRPDDHVARAARRRRAGKGSWRE